MYVKVNFTVWVSTPAELTRHSLSLNLEPFFRFYRALYIHVFCSVMSTPLQRRCPLGAEESGLEKSLTQSSITTEALDSTQST